MTTTWVVILVAAAGTFAQRASFLVFAHRLAEVSPRAQRVLRQIPPTETRANMTAMMDELKRRGIPVLLTGMKAPPNLGADYVARFDAIWPDLATRYGGTLYPFILDGVIGDSALMQGDRVHPNAAGVAKIADRVAPMVKTRLTAE